MRGMAFWCGAWATCGGYWNVGLRVRVGGDEAGTGCGVVPRKHHTGV